MGLIRKAASMSTLGAVKYTSKREALTKKALAEAKLAKVQADALRAAEPTVGPAAGPRPADPDLPWWRQATLGQAIQAARDRRRQDS